VFDLNWSKKRSIKFEVIPSIKKTQIDQSLIEKSGLLFWEEHCVECAAPSCYKTCTLFDQREDGLCRRFENGIYPNQNYQGLFNFGAEITIRKWGKIYSKTSFNRLLVLFKLKKIKKYQSLEKFFGQIITTLSRLFSYFYKTNKFFRFYEKLRILVFKSKVFNSLGTNITPSGFYIKYFVPQKHEKLNLVFEIKHENTIFTKSLSLNKGWHEIYIPFKDIPFALGKDLTINLWNPGEEPIHIIITWLDFVLFKSQKTKNNYTKLEVEKPKIKCLAWDLDNTLWDGVIGDDGSENVKLNKNIIEIIKELDNRGILQTIISKNNYDVAWEKIIQLGIDKYFLFPAIHWGPKSESLKLISTKLNINLDTFGMIDDSSFERAEVSERFPEVRVYDPAKQINSLLQFDEFKVAITQLSIKRRLSYLEESKRKKILATTRADYDSFLRSCELKMIISSPKTDEEKDRCFELLQRTNQLNISKNDYTRSEFLALFNNSKKICLFFHISDRFGDYGIVGFSVLDNDKVNKELNLIDLVISCRVAEKKVEETFLCWLIKGFTKFGYKKLNIYIKKTSRNKPIRDVINKLPFKHKKKKDEYVIKSWIFKDKTVEEPGIIKIDSSVHLIDN